MINLIYRQCEVKLNPFMPGDLNDKTSKDLYKVYKNNTLPHYGIDV